MSETIEVTIYLKSYAHSSGQYKIYIESGPTPNQQDSGVKATFTLAKGGRYYVYGEYDNDKNSRQGGPFTAVSDSESVYMNET